MLIIRTIDRFLLFFDLKKNNFRNKLFFRFKIFLHKMVAIHQIHQKREKIRLIIIFYFLVFKMRRLKITTKKFKI